MPYCELSEDARHNILRLVATGCTIHLQQVDRHSLMLVIEREGEDPMLIEFAAWTTGYIPPQWVRARVLDR